MKVILNKDLATLGEEGDVKDVAKGYARNYLFPRRIALPYTEKTIELFEGRKDEIEARKAQKRQDAAGLKEKLEALTLTLSMPAGANGKLYGAVTVQTVAEELVKQGFQIERKKIEIPGNTIKSVGRYKVFVKLYESSAAECTVTVEGQALKTETRTSPLQRGRRRETAADTAAAPETAAAETAAGTGEAAAEAVPAAASPPAETAAAAVPAAEASDAGASAEDGSPAPAAADVL
ncbi:MAG: 50S ribosomal protein L9 [Treponema sp.]|jgi:large subunit ribosomal protein L9|nr:50S ribosomal protein L9 [Treponema sp.]